MTPIRLTRTIAELRASLAPERRAGRTIGLVPTMGYLHRGHMALVERARAECDVVVLTVFVNPTQFGPNEDLSSYPRDLDGDIALSQTHGVDIVFAPDVAEMYPEPIETTVDVAPLSGILIGLQRPGHFQGVATVVAKLLNIARPDRAYFGEKDFQQLTVIRRMVRDLSMDVAIVGVPTVREVDGLAASSRNVRLSAEDRRAAAVIARALGEGAALVEEGERDAARVVERVRSVLSAEPRAEIRSVDLRSSRRLDPVRTIGGEAVVVLVTARFGDVLLIDQREILPTATPATGRDEKRTSDERREPDPAEDRPGHPGAQGRRADRRAHRL